MELQAPTQGLGDKRQKRAFGDGDVEDELEAKHLGIEVDGLVLVADGYLENKQVHSFASKLDFGAYESCTHAGDAHRPVVAADRLRASCTYDANCRLSLHY